MALAGGTWFSLAVQSLVVAAGAVWYRAHHRELFGLDLFRKHIAGVPQADRFFHLRHRHYLSSALSYRQRVECALSHYRYEDFHHDSIYKDAVYRDGGLTLWERTVGTHRFEILLRGPRKLLHEGGTSILMMVDDTIVCEMSYSWVDGAIFGRPDCGPLQFVTRNQSTRSDASALNEFRRAFAHNSPSYFCFAALQGVAAAHRRPHVVGVRHHCQGAFEARYLKSFQRSYCEFWRAFSGVELDQQSFLIPVPLATPPLSEIRAKHRKRALERRQLWSTISSSARAVALRHKVPRP